ncbi:uncharacterized protein LOC122506804 [Leptopilina heterotoma]|uniref:uncharacterized protein LOC122506804 n=1 Tax=Leptopilina heterotoma TaxID=63436 RepID=UPI001CA94A38|nr:uncharacterized protein LOC122506804 [Leptopilina heterotoma]
MDQLPLFHQSSFFNIFHLSFAGSLFANRENCGIKGGLIFRGAKNTRKLCFRSHWYVVKLALFFFPRGGKKQLYASRLSLTAHLAILVKTAVERYNIYVYREISHKGKCYSSHFMTSDASWGCGSESRARIYEQGFG